MLRRDGWAVLSYLARLPRHRTAASTRCGVYRGTYTGPDASARGNDPASLHRPCLCKCPPVLLATFALTLSMITASKPPDGVANPHQSAVPRPLAPQPSVCGRFWLAKGDTGLSGSIRGLVARRAPLAWWSQRRRRPSSRPLEPGMGTMHQLIPSQPCHATVEETWSQGDTIEPSGEGWASHGQDGQHFLSSEDIRVDDTGSIPQVRASTSEFRMMDSLCTLTALHPSPTRIRKHSRRALACQRPRKCLGHQKVPRRGHHIARYPRTVDIR